MVSGRDEEFLALFAQEAEQRLADLTAHLLALEQTGNDPELVNSIFREAHTLKGGAAVVGLEAFSQVAHALEDVLEQLRSGERMATPALIDSVLGAVDGLQAMLPLAIEGSDYSVAAATLVQSLGALVEASDATQHDAEGGGDAGVGSSAVEAPARHQSSGDAEAVRVPLSRLDELIRLVGESAAAHLRVGRMISQRLETDPSTIDEVRELSRLLNELQELAMRARMVPVVTITDMLQRAVRDVARATGKDVRWEVRGEDTELDRSVLQQLGDPLLHLVRNAVDHGIESADERVAAGKPAQATVRFHAMQLGSEVILTVTDDGGGIDVERVRAEASRGGGDTSPLTDEEAAYLVFRSGVSTADFVSEISGRGVGLDVVRANVEAARGRVEIRTEAGVGTEFRIVVPITLAVLRCLLIEAGGQTHAIPMHSIVLAQSEGAEARSEGQPVVWVGNQAVALATLSATLGLPLDDGGPVIVVAGLTRQHAFRVGALMGQRDVVVKGLSRLLPRLDVIAGASVEPDGSIVLVLDVAGLIDRARMAQAGRAVAVIAEDRTGAATRAPVRAKVLVVDDALTVRELQRSILERGGYDVLTASDGLEAMAILAEGPVDLVLTDVEMPRMDGFALTEAIRGHPARGNVPVLILTSRANEEDRQRGLEAGADGYIVKSAFNEAALLSAVQRLLGR
ncbi:MAG: two-component system, chemotaxis family, sensor kinase CheA [Actinomycetota bacterium]|jgi:two-component system chemotaxis sensor kinase CheA|nr:two-component system, chemotaxis family, sensor kinase CheA [Actinomycetota bacterium]